MARLKVRFIASRHYLGIGFFNAGDEEYLEESIAKQFIEQGFAEEVKAPRPRPKKPTLHAVFDKSEDTEEETENDDA